MIRSVSGRLINRHTLGFTLTPTRIAGIYFLFGLVFLYISDVIFVRYLSDPFLSQVQALKGGVEVLLTAGLIFILTTVSRRQIEEKNAKLRRRSDTIDVLSRVLRHNLRNDLNVVRAHLNMAADEVSDSVASCETAMAKIDELVELADTAREIESVLNSTFKPQPIEVTALTERVIEQVKTDHSATSVTLESPDTVFIEADPLFKRALEELVENAAKHAGDSPAVTVSIDQSAKCTEITISDNGPGLPESEQKVLKEGDETNMLHGSGLGLWLARLIVTNHDGTITTDIDETGTHVTISLPRITHSTEFSESETLLGQFHRAQDRFEAIFEESFDAIAIIDDDMRYTDVNEAAAELLGVTQEELRGRSISEFVPEEWKDENVDVELSATGADSETVPIRRADGTVLTVEYTTVMDFIPGQHLAIFRDVTERIEREQQLELAETVFENTQDALFVIDVTEDQEFYIQRVNAVYEELTGLSNEEIQGKPPREVVGDEIGSEIEAQYRDCVERRETIEYPEEIPVEGELRHWQTKLTPVVEDGRVVTLVGAMRDVTAQKA